MLLRYGPAAIDQSKENLAMHASSYTSHRVGFGDALFYRGEKTMADVKANGGTPAKKAQIEAAKPKFYVMFLVMLVIIALYVLRSPEPIHRHIHWMMIPLFLVTNAQINYYNMRVLLVMYHASDLGKYRNKLGLSLLFLTEVATHIAFCLGWTRYAVTAMSSICLTAYFALMTAFLVADIIQSFRKREDAPAAPAPQEV